MSQLTERQLGRLTEYDQWFRRFMPYQFAEMKGPRGTAVYLPVNRDYKPLGLKKEDCQVPYELYMGAAVTFAADPHTFKDVWTNIDGLYLYNDGYNSRRDYFERLERLHRHPLKLVGEKGVR